MNKNPLTETDRLHLQTCLELAKEAIENGDKPFGSILVGSDGEILRKARNRVNELTALAHPEYELALWAAENLSLEERRKTTIYTTGEHCPMCSAAHGWAELGTIVYLSSGKQLSEWLREFQAPSSPIEFYPVEQIIKNIEVRGPASGELLEEIKNLHKKYYEKQI